MKKKTIGINSRLLLCILKTNKDTLNNFYKDNTMHSLKTKKSKMRKKNFCQTKLTNPSETHLSSFDNPHNMSTKRRETSKEI